MSNSLAIAAVTRTLRNLLQQGIKPDFPDLPADVRPTAEIQFSTLPLNQAEEGDNGKNRINIFLYQMSVNAAWRNTDLPHQVKPGETGYPPLALNLYYLITAYGQDHNELVSHFLLGQVMSLFHDHPVLSRSEIRDALAASGLHEQIERVRITPEPLALDHSSKLWTGFQASYRLSAAYQVSVILIESTRPTRTPLPVLTRGPDDRGVTSQPDIEPPPPPFPVITAVEVEGGEPSAELGRTLTIRGYNLAGDGVSLRFTHPHLDNPFVITDAITRNTPTEITVILSDPADPEPGVEAWPGPPGLYTVAAQVTVAGQEETTNELPFSLAPKITQIDVEREGNDALVNVIFSPRVLPRQRVSLLLGDREVPTPPGEGEEPQDTLKARVTDVPAGDYFVRLRVDGVDSLLVNRSVTPPVFDESARVTIP